MVDTAPNIAESKQESISGNVTTSSNAGDLEKGPDSSLRGQDDQSEQHDSSTRDPNIVDWDGPDDPQNPLNWSFKKKGTLIASISIITFLTLVKRFIPQTLVHFVLTYVAPLDLRYSPQESGKS